MKSEIHEQLRNLIIQLSNSKEKSVSEIKEIALDVYNKAVLLEFLDHSKEGESSNHETESSQIAAETPEVFISESEEKEEPNQLELIEIVEIKEKTEEEIQIDEPIQEEEPIYKSALNELEQFAAEFQNMPEFERKIPQYKPVSKQNFALEPEAEIQMPFKENEDLKQSLSKKFTDNKPKSLNDSLNRGLAIGLNDRLAFINHLFEGQIEDYTRVLSQINTLGTFEEAKKFIENQVKPDYNEWQHKEEISGRFMMIIEKTFR